MLNGIVRKQYQRCHGTTVDFMLAENRCQYSGVSINVLKRLTAFLATRPRLVISLFAIYADYYLLLTPFEQTSRRFSHRHGDSCCPSCQFVRTIPYAWPPRLEIRTSSGCCSYMVLMRTGPIRCGYSGGLPRETMGREYSGGPTTAVGA